MLPTYPQKILLLLLGLVLQPAGGRAGAGAGGAGLGFRVTPAAGAAHGAGGAAERTAAGRTAAAAPAAGTPAQL